ncbi:MAG: hypothetical protein MHPSP_003535 [Paramarteilia canceri]
MLCRSLLFSGIRRGRVKNLVNYSIYGIPVGGIIKLMTIKSPIDDDVDIQQIVKETDGLSGADITSIFQEAGICALEEDIKSDKISMRHINRSLNQSRFQKSQQNYLNDVCRKLSNL